MTTPAQSSQSQEPSKADFSLAYDGEALADHTMSIRDLAPALLALAQAFDRANALLNGEAAKLSLDIKATPEGSFEVALVLQQIFETGVAAFNSDFVTSAANFKELFLGGGAFGFGGVIWAIKKLNGKVPKVTLGEPNEDGIDDGMASLEASNVRIRVPFKALQLLMDRPLREHLEDAVAPLKRAGIDTLRFKDDGVTIETITDDELHAFSADAVENESVTEIPFTRLVLTPDTVSLTLDGKWRLNDGGGTKWYAVTDKGFLQRVESGEIRFGKGDRLVCNGVIRQLVSAVRVTRMEYEVTEVVEHLVKPTQPPLSSDETANL